MAEPKFAKPYYSPEEYLRMEEHAEYKSEYIFGEIYAMVGGTGEHSSISSNVISELGVLLRGKPCRVYNSDLRIMAMEHGIYSYADALVICGEPDYVLGRRDTITNPILIVEVLSPSTENYDRGKKFEIYRSIPTLQSYLLVDQSRIYVEHHRKVANNNWLMESYTDINQYVPIPAIDVTIAIANLYDKIEF
jgi:Uma2 family endonuclease